MKTLLFITILITAGFAGSDRTWTDADTKRAIEGKLIKKDERGKEPKVTIALKGTGKTVILNPKRLVKADQDYAIVWRNHHDRLSLTALRKGPRPDDYTHTLRFLVKASAEPVKIVILPKLGGKEQTYTVEAWTAKKPEFSFSTGVLETFTAKLYSERGSLLQTLDKDDL